MRKQFVFSVFVSERKIKTPDHVAGHSFFQIPTVITQQGDESKYI